jgi:hypothetical protein
VVNKQLVLIPDWDHLGVSEAALEVGPLGEGLQCVPRYKILSAVGVTLCDSCALT